MKLSLNTTNFTALKMTAVVALLSLASVAPLSLAAQQVATARAATPAAAPARTVAAEGEAEEAAAPQKPGVEGIKIHGHWVIDVHNADGTVVEHRDFQNALQASGASLMATLVTGRLAVSSLVVVLTSATPNSYAIAPANVTQLLGICNPTSNANLCSRTLTTTSDQATGHITLAGNYQFTAADTISTVNTYLLGCLATAPANVTVSPAACAASPDNTSPSGTSPAGAPFTGTAIAPLPVAAGQFVTVTVVLSFS